MHNEPALYIVLLARLNSLERGRGIHVEAFFAVIVIAVLLSCFEEVIVTIGHHSSDLRRIFKVKTLTLDVHMQTKHQSQETGFG